MAQWVKGFLYEHEDLSSDLQHPCKGLAQRCISAVEVLVGKAETGGSPGLSGLPV